MQEYPFCQGTALSKLNVEDILLLLLHYKPNIDDLGFREKQQVSQRNRRVVAFHQKSTELMSTKY